MSRTTYAVESLVPSWLLHDTGYRQALTQYLTDRMAAQGDQPDGPVRIRQADDSAPPPVGMILLRATAETEDFDVEVPAGDGV
ncbi:hypothetical protein K378_01435 [Streptomyces sp. Amel2xB2]|uniref:hypothetical protein n=1 Tax=Streptomyces sp. Amel2xB2 TaxID=1305829 RepID=UPI000DB9A1D3|nr:hypothetical protein [Streptomyces sp. Amel2xB2]RAJ70270.1 hypothetical protein K378_01435 [Streptomyces sp. Amel2xB2]